MTTDPKALWAAAFVAAQAEMPSIPKTKTANMGTYSYKYADLSDITDAVRPVLAEHGLAAAQSPESVQGGIGIVTRIIHEAGHIETFGPLILSAGGNAQAAGSAITYARRYALCAALGLVPDEDDDGKAANAKVSAGSANTPTENAEPNAAPVASQPEVSANSWAEEETEGSAAPGSRPSSSSWDVLIEEHGRDLVWETAKKIAKDLRDGLVPIKVEMLDKCSPRVYAATAEVLSQAKANA